METKYTFQMQRVFKMKLTLLSFKNPKLWMLETHGQEDVIKKVGTLSKFKGGALLLFS